MKNTAKTKARRSASSRWILLTAAVAALGSLGVTSSVRAQYAANNSLSNTQGAGRARDLSNRIGSGGYNEGGITPGTPGQAGNALVTNNITGGQGFRGNISYFDPGAFHGTLAGGNIDAFVAQSSGVTTNGVVSNNTVGGRVFLGDSRGVNAPAGFMSLGNVGGYVPSPTINNALSAPAIGDTRLGGSAAYAGATPLASSLGQAMFLPAGQGANGNIASGYITASPLTGVQAFSYNQQTGGGQGLSNSALINQGPLGGRVDQSALDRIRALNDPSSTDQLSSSAGIGSAGFNSTRYQPGSANNLGVPSSNNNALNGGSASLNGGPMLNQNGATGSGLNQSQALDHSIGGNSLGAPLGGGTFSSSDTGTQRLTGSLSTGEDTSTNVLSVVQPSPTYTRMLQQFKAANPNAPLTAQQKSLLTQATLRDLNAQKKAKEAKLGNDSGPVKPRSDAPGRGAMPGGTPGLAPSGTPGSISTPPSGGTVTGAVIPSQLPYAKEKQKPIVVSSFGADEQAKGTKELLTKAEDLMKQGKYTAALEQYDLVEAVAPNSPFALLGRANAELGASYYGLAESHLRQAFMTDQTLTMAQYDLEKFLGNDRLDYLVKDLKQIALTNPSQARPVFLLSYIEYNTGKTREAAAHLNLAEKREGKPDPFFSLLKKNWDLPDVGTDAPDMNK